MMEFSAVFEKTSSGWSPYAPDLSGLDVVGGKGENKQPALHRAAPSFL
jgi:hypothetical protein